MKNPIKRLFYVPKHSKATDKSSFYQIFLCLLSMIFSISCLASITWAWFSDTVSIGDMSITTAKYTVAVTVINSSDNGIINANEQGSYPLKSGDYKITMTAEGTVKKSSGYCKMIIGGNEYYSPLLKAEKSDVSNDINSITFNVKLHEPAELAFSSSWEAYPEGNLQVINTDEVITYGKPQIINEGKEQGEENTEIEGSPEDINEDKQQVIDSDEKESSPTVINGDSQQESINTETENSQDNNKKSKDDSVGGVTSATDEQKDTISVETEVP